MIQHERDQKSRFEKMVEQMARQHSYLEEAAQHVLPPSAPASNRSSRKLIAIFLLFIIIKNVIILPSKFQIKVFFAYIERYRIFNDCMKLEKIIEDYYHITMYTV